VAEHASAPGGAEVVVTADPAALAREAARRLTDALGSAIEARGAAHLALTGGSSATTLYRELAANWRDAIDWRRVHLWWGDERFVPVDHPESNIGMSYASLLQASARSGMSGVGGQGADVTAGDMPGLDVHAENIHPLEIDEAMSETDAAGLVAQRYAEELEQRLPHDASGMPAFDVILLGVGDDGHIMSVFPGSPALEPDAPLVLPIPAPDHIGPHLPRITLNPSLLRAAGQIIVMIPGEGKAEIVSRIMRDPGADVASLPSRLALRPNAVWLLDEEAAAKLGSH
jgi:6-phosphogluconolactonase